LGGNEKMMGKEDLTLRQAMFWLSLEQICPMLSMSECACNQTLTP